MKFLRIQSACEQQLTDIIEIDLLCFGGLWSKEGYQREIVSSSSILLTLSVGDLELCNLKSIQTKGIEQLKPIEPKQTKVAQPHTNEHLIGIGCLWTILEEAHITLVGITPDYQRQGLGQLLFHALLQETVGRKLERATLEVKVSNQAAINLYEKFGFRLAGTRKKYYAKTGEDALILWRGGLKERQFQNDLINWKTEIINRLAEHYVLLESQTTQL